MNRFKNILYVLNPMLGTNLQSWARAVSLATNNQAEITVLRVIPKLSLATSAKLLGLSGADLEAKVMEHEKAELQRLISSLDPPCTGQAELKAGKLYIEIIRLVQSKNIDLVIKEADSISWLDRFFTSDDMHLLRKCPCPVWLMKADEKPAYRQIMAAVDFDDESEDNVNSELNQKIIGFASSLSLSEFAALHVVSVYDITEFGFASLWAEQPEKLEKELSEEEYQNRKYHMKLLFDELRNDIGQDSYDYLAPRSRILKGLPACELPKMADTLQADLVVMGTIARSGIAGAIIGNTAETVLSQLHCSVLAVKPKGFVSPVT